MMTPGCVFTNDRFYLRLSTLEDICTTLVAAVGARDEPPSYDMKAVTKEQSIAENFTTLAGFELRSPRQKSNSGRGDPHLTT